METAKSLPKWFWISIGAIILITLWAVRKCNNDKTITANNTASDLNSAAAATPNNATPTVLDQIQGLQIITG